MSQPIRFRCREHSQARCFDVCWSDRGGGFCLPFQFLARQAAEHTIGDLFHARRGCLDVEAKKEARDLSDRRASLVAS
jgi:hypothetical protein